MQQDTGRKKYGGVLTAYSRYTKDDRTPQEEQARAAETRKDATETDTSTWLDIRDIITGNLVAGLDIQAVIPLSVLQGPERIRSQLVNVQLHFDSEQRMCKP